MSKRGRLLSFLFSVDYKILVVIFSIVKLMASDGPPEHP
ncbi:hypothetical protein BH09DEP1_BH09DEP1_1520 [soil metagenome]